MPYCRVALVVALVCLMFATVVAAAEERPVARQLTVAEAAATAADNPLLPISLATLFEAVASQTKVTIAPDGTGTMTPGTVEVLVAKIGPDGKVVTGCVNSPALAERFFAPRTRQQVLSPTGPKE